MDIQRNKRNNLVYCITQMKEYENKSLLQLRAEDYMAYKQNQMTGEGLNNFNAYLQKENKAPNATSFLTPGTSVGNPSSMNLFGSPPNTHSFNPPQPSPIINTGNTTNIFQQKPAPTIGGAINFSLSNPNPTPAPFGQNPSSLFNQPSTPSTNIFAPTPTATNNLFG